MPSDKANTRGQAVPAAQVPLWMATFADMMALMMCFFTLLFAMSKTEEEKFKAVAGSLRVALGGVQFITRPSPTPSPTPSMMPASAGGSPATHAIRPPRPALQALQRLQERLQGEIRVGNLQVRRGSQPDQLIISLPEHVAFASGSARLMPQAKTLIDKLVSQLDPSVRQLTVAGHSDSIPLRNSRYYSSNWDLSASRAVAVAERILAGGVITASKLSVRGHADTQPVAPNDTAENRARNRRVEWLLDFAPPPDSTTASSGAGDAAAATPMVPAAAPTTVAADNEVSTPSRPPDAKPRIQLPPIPAVLEQAQVPSRPSATTPTPAARPSRSAATAAAIEKNENAQRLIQALRDGGLVQQ